jgi:hypothetical protein
MKRALLLLVIFSLFVSGCQLGPLYFGKTTDLNTERMQQQKAINAMQSDLDELKVQLSDVLVDLNESHEEITVLEVERDELESELSIVQEQYELEKAELIAEQEELVGKCDSDADCKRLDFVSKQYCMQGHSYRIYERYGCENAGTSSAKCVVVKQETDFEECDSDRVCKAGVCLKLSNVPCQDTDGGYNYFEKGTVMDALGAKLTDACSSSNSDSLYERYCHEELINGQKVQVLRTQLFSCSSLCKIDDYDCHEAGKETSGTSPYKPSCKDGVCMDYCRIDESKPLYARDNLKRCIRETDAIDITVGAQMSAASSDIVIGSKNVMGQ